MDLTLAAPIIYINAGERRKVTGKRSRPAGDRRTPRFFRVFYGPPLDASLNAAGGGFSPIIRVSIKEPGTAGLIQRRTLFEYAGDLAHCWKSGQLRFRGNKQNVEDEASRCRGDDRTEVQAWSSRLNKSVK